MRRGSCLCGAVTWTVEGELELPHACHCSMCRKTHGTGYGAYAAVQADGFRWTSGEDLVTPYRASETLLRPFCSRCGSTVPGAESTGPRYSMPLGSLDDADIRMLGHIFVGSMAAWDEITDDLPQYDAWPPGYGFPVLPTPERPRADGRVTGSCLCGEIAYEVTPPLTTMRHCHCSRCRRARSAPHASNAVCPIAAFRFTRGEAALRTFKVPDAQFFAQTFCTHCGSKMPRVSAERGFVVIPGGSFDVDPGVRPVEHIFVGSKAKWFEITDTLPRHTERP